MVFDSAFGRQGKEIAMIAASTSQSVSVDLAELVSASQRGELEAFSNLYRAFYPRAVQIALHWTRRIETAEDMVQQTFLIVYNNLNKLREPRAFHSWFARILHNRLVNSYRRESRLPLSFSDEALEYAVAKTESPDRELERTEAPGELSRVFSQLTEIDREALRLRELEHLRYAEIARRLNVPLGTVKRRIHVARERLSGVLHAM